MDVLIQLIPTISAIVGILVSLIFTIAKIKAIVKEANVSTTTLRTKLNSIIAENHDLLKEINIRDAKIAELAKMAGEYRDLVLKNVEDANEALKALSVENNDIAQIKLDVNAIKKQIEVL